MDLFIEYCGEDEDRIKEWDDPTFVLTHANCVPAYN